MAPRIVIPPEKPATTPPSQGQLSRRWWLNVTAGVIVIIAVVAGLIAAYAAIGSWLKEPTIHIVTYIPGTVDIEPNIDITYNGDVIGKIDSAQVNIPGSQLNISRGESDPPAWHVLTFPGGVDDTAYAGSLRIVSRPGDIDVAVFAPGEGHETAPTDLFTILTQPPEYPGRVRCKAPFRIASVNGRGTAGGDVVVEPGDEIRFQGGYQMYALQWTAPGAFTRVYGRIAYRQLQSRTIVKTDSSRLMNGSSSVTISNTFGLTKTTAHFTPTFEAPLITHVIALNHGDPAPGSEASGKGQSYIEMRSGGSTSLDDLQATLAYLTSRTKLNQPPSNRLETMASNIDTTLAGIKGTVNEVRYGSLPAVKNVVNRAGGDVDSLVRSLEVKLATLESHLTSLTDTANGRIVKLTDTTASTLASLQLRIDLLLEEIRLTTAQLRKTANGVGADIHNVVK
jgi:hypothetical protein